MKLAGFFWLVTGWAIILAAVVLLQSSARAAFLMAGFSLQIVGMTLVVRAHRIPRGDKT